MSSPDAARALTRRAVEIFRSGDAAAACDFAAAPAMQDRLPEIFMLLHTPGLTPERRARLTDSAWPAAGNKDAAAPALAQLGALGFSFPKWRFLTQGAPAVVEDFGLRRLRRATDLRDADLPDPRRDEFGIGFVLEKEGNYIEYRRAYILAAPAGMPALLVRNNSHYFGRDRLPAPALLSQRPLTPQAMAGIAPGLLEDFTPFAALRPEALPALCAALALIADFEARFFDWLRGPGLAGLARVLTTQSQARPLPYLGLVAAHLPPWQPQASRALTREDLAGLVQTEIEVPKGLQLVALSGAQGDLPGI